jgi:hypothetical protein
MLIGALLAWQDAYLSNQPKSYSNATSKHFRNSSLMGHVLAVIVLDVPFTAVQDAVGKNAKKGIAAAIPDLRRWMDSDPETAENTIHTAVKTIEYLATKRVGIASSEQSIIAMFLCYVLAWLFVNIASVAQKRRFLNRFPENSEIWKCPQLAYIKRGLERKFENEGASNPSKTELSRGILGSAAQSLTQLGTWGAALNLALLLQRRSEM